MVDLQAKTPCAGLLPRTVGGISLTEADPGPLTILMPRKGADAEAALRAVGGLGWPAPGGSTGAGRATVLWCGRGQAMLAGVAPDPALAEAFALSEQSDAWAVVDLAGVGAEDVLARLVPIDLRAAALPEGATARTLCGHVGILITRTAPASFRLFAFRSMARTLTAHLVEAAETVAGRAALS